MRLELWRDKEGELHLVTPPGGGAATRPRATMEWLFVGHVDLAFTEYHGPTAWPPVDPDRIGTMRDHDEGPLA